MFLPASKPFLLCVRVYLLWRSWIWGFAKRTQSYQGQSISVPWLVISKCHGVRLQRGHGRLTPPSIWLWIKYHWFFENDVRLTTQPLKLIFSDSQVKVALPMLASTHAYTLAAVNQVVKTSGTTICSSMYDGEFNRHRIIRSNTLS